MRMKLSAAQEALENYALVSGGRSIGYRIHRHHWQIYLDTTWKPLPLSHHRSVLKVGAYNAGTLYHLCHSVPGLLNSLGRHVRTTNLSTVGQ